MNLTSTRVFQNANVRVMQEATKLVFIVDAGLYRLEIKRHKVRVFICRLCNLAAQLILPTCTHKRDFTNTFGAYWAIHLHNSRAHNGDTLILYIDLVGMGPNNYPKFQISCPWQVYITSSELPVEPSAVVCPQSFLELEQPWLNSPTLN